MTVPVDLDMILYRGSVQAIIPGINFTCSEQFSAGHLQLSGGRKLQNSLSYRYGGAVEMGPILKSGALQ